jgi:hypothetical protein
MIIKGKEIKAETISMWANILGFIIGILFYFRIENNAQQNTHVVPPNPVRDSVLVINTELKSQLQQLKISQDSLIKEVRQQTELLKTQKRNVTVIRHQLQATIQSDWDSLSPQQQNAYVNQIMSNLKTNSK